MYGLALMAGGQVLNGYGDAQSASAARGELGAEYGRQQGYNQAYSDDLNATIPKMGAPALRADIAAASAPILASQKQTQTLGNLLGRDLGPNSGAGVAGATSDAIRQNGYGVSAFGLRRAQEMQGRTLADLMSRRQRLATKADASANLLPYYLRAAALKGSAASDTGQLMSTAGSMWAARGSSSKPAAGAAAKPGDGVVLDADGYSNDVRASDRLQGPSRVP